MKTKFWFIVSVLMVSACSSVPSSPYQAAKGSGYGYTEKSLGGNSYRIEFRMANGTVKKAEDYAILRAAELTISQGYDWFEVKKRYSWDDNYNKHHKKINDIDIDSNQQISRECGLLGCRTQLHRLPNSNFDNQIDFPEVSAVLEISFGKGVRPAKEDIYDALETSETLGNKLSAH
ncbi:MAG: hypothetical protein EOO52_06685 [Gammaproteobacteria bacterium]|nr:MAG: hypothetical protein EOO52_06685 [Gammaproteobacteria bacterium]